MTTFKKVTTTEDLVTLMEGRLKFLREEHSRAARHVTERSSASHVQSAASVMDRAEGADLELSLLLRYAHGMNPNGQWPHPEGKCTHCGRDTSNRTCSYAACKRSRNV